MSMRLAVSGLVLATALAACSTSEDDPVTPGAASGKVSGGGLFGPGASDLAATRQPQIGQGISVNSFLWRAALDTLSFMPLASADPFGGVIITDWYSPPDAPVERFKVNVFILDRHLSSDGIRAAVFRQKREADGRWVDSPVSGSTQTDLENAILARARQLRVNSVPSSG
jgi:hypothetical protein